MLSLQKREIVMQMSCRDAIHRVRLIPNLLLNGFQPMIESYSCLFYPFPPYFPCSRWYCYFPAQSDKRIG